MTKTAQDATTERHPGMMGDGTEEQNLNQPGHPEARITEAEVSDAFETETTPSTRPIEPAKANEKVDQLAEQLAHAEDRQEALIDEGVEESFPASDPPSVKQIT